MVQQGTNDLKKLKEVQQGTNDLKKLKDLISRGNEAIEEAELRHYGKIDSAVFLYGNTGAGKTTTLYHLGKKELKAVSTPEGNWVLEPKVPIKNITVDHSYSSGTRIPNSYYTEVIFSDADKNAQKKEEKVLIVDFPGLNDTGEPVQEVANAFYIKPLLQAFGKNVRFILVVSESSITNDRGTEFLEIVDRFSKTFTEVDFLSNSLSLIITKVPKHKTVEHLCKSIQNIEEQNISFTDNYNVKNILGTLKNSVHVIYRKEEEGLFPRDTKILSNILTQSTGVEVKSDLVKFNISEKSKTFITELAKTIEECFLFIVSVISEANTKKHFFTNEDTQPFEEHHDDIKRVEFTPSSIDSPKIDKKFSREVDGDFAFIEFLKELKDSLTGDKMNLDSIKFILVRNLKVFESSSKESDIKLKVADYIITIKNSIECLKFLKNSCDKPSNVESTAFNSIAQCFEFVNNELETEIFKIKLISDKEINYFEQALKLFNFYPENPKYKELVSECKYLMAELYFKKGDLLKAKEFLIESVTLNPTNNFYNYIGDALYKVGEYKLSLEAYKLKNHPVGVKKCFKKIEEKILSCDHEEQSKFYQIKAEYYQQIGLWGKASIYFYSAQSLSSNDILSKAIGMLKKDQNAGPQQIIHKWETIKEKNGALDEKDVQSFADILSKWVPTVSTSSMMVTALGSTKMELNLDSYDSEE